MTNRTFSVGINPTIHNKPHNSTVNHATNWQNENLTLEKLVEHIKQGNAFSAQFDHGYRKTQNFICSNMIAADIDGSWTIEAILDQPFVKDKAAFLYTTVSHTADQPRFRIVFLLEQTIVAAKEWAQALAGLGKKLNGDPAIKDAARLFYGNSEATFYVLNNTLPAQDVSELIEMGAQPSQTKPELSLSAGASYRSSKRLGLDDQIQTAAGKQQSLRSLPRLTSVKCPYHLDRNHSAFVVHSVEGHHGIHCMACNATFWSENPRDYDFDAFDKLFDQVQRQEMAAIETTVNQPKNAFLRCFPPKPTRVITHDQYLSPIVYKPGLTLIKSPKGTGKTEAIKSLVTQVKAKSYLEAIPVADRCNSILLIGHRRALIQEACFKLGLDFYLDSPDQTPSAYYGICLDSLTRLKSERRLRKYDLVIIDESEQVLRHLLSDTIAKRMGGTEGCFSILEYLVRSAKAVVALDADLGMLTSHAFKTMRAADWENRCRIIYNKPALAQSNQTLMLYEKRGRLVEHMMQSIRDGKKCFVTTNSKKWVARLSKMIETEFKGGIRQISITSDNSRDPTNIEFLKNIKQRFLEIDVLLASPSLGTGIDITFPDNAPLVDCVYGFFVANVNMHTDIDQQLARVRHPGSVRVWISPQRFRFETAFDVIRDDLARASTVRSAITGYDADGCLQYDSENPLLVICSHMVCASRASKKNLLKLFYDLRRTQGWDIKLIRDADAKTAFGNRRLRRAKAAVEINWVEALMGAGQLSEKEFTEIDRDVRRGNHVSPAQRAQHEKFHLERSLGVKLTPEIIELNKDGKLIAKVKLFSSLQYQYNDLVFVQLANKLTVPATSQRWCKTKVKPFLAFVVFICGLLDNGDINRDAIVSQNSLERFVTFCALNKTVIEEITGDLLRQDIDTRAVMQLNKFLAFAGLKLVTSARKTSDGVQTHEYKLDRRRLDLMTSLADNYRLFDSQKRAA